MWLKRSVGQGGRNDAADVLVTKHMLSAIGQSMSPLLSLSLDNNADNFLNDGITRFQKEIAGFGNPDGRIDVPGRSLTALEGMVNLGGSVGYGGANREGDVFMVQSLLDLHGKYTHLMGPLGNMCLDLEFAITDFQKDIVKLSHPDGRVDPAGRTFKALIGFTTTSGGGGTVPSKVKFKQFTAGTGAYSYSTPREQWATEKTIASINKAAKKFHEEVGVEIGLGHMSLSNGAKFPPHSSHRTGKNIDVRPVRSDDKHSPTTITSTEYSQSRTESLIKILREATNLKSILFNDSVLYGKYTNVKYYKGHHNHLHLSYNN